LAQPGPGRGSEIYILSDTDTQLAAAHGAFADARAITL